MWLVIADEISEKPKTLKKFLFSKCSCQFGDKLYVLVEFSCDEVPSIRKLVLTCLF